MSQLNAISLDDATKIGNVLKAIANARRLQILSVIMKNGEASVGDIDDAIKDLNQSPISQHLSRLREQGVVQSRKEQQKRIYSISSPEMRDFLEATVFAGSLSDESLTDVRDAFVVEQDAVIKSAIGE